MRPTSRSVFSFRTPRRGQIHRNVVRSLDHGFSKGVFSLVLEYCDGGSVADLIEQRGGRLPVDEAVELALQALDGLACAHTAAIPFVRKPDGG